MEIYKKQKQAVLQISNTKIKVIFSHLKLITKGVEICLERLEEYCKIALDESGAPTKICTESEKSNG